MSTETHYSRRFYVAWFGLFTLISMAMNGAHSFIAAPRSWAGLTPTIRDWLTVTGGMPTWFAITAVMVSQIPPVALACATNALVKPDPHTTSGRGSAARTTTWTIALGAFILSAIAMTDLTHMLLGVPLYVAAIMPIIVDISIVAAVLRLEIRRSGHAAEAHLPDESSQAPATSPLHEAPLKQPELRRGSDHEAPVERTTGHVEPPHEERVERTTVTRESPMKRPAERPVTRSTTHREPLILTRDAATVAQMIVDQTTISQPTKTIAKVLDMAASGASQRDIAKAKIASATTAGRIISAAKELEQQPAADELTDMEHRLAAVG